jgi:hypothetical protein
MQLLSRSPPTEKGKYKMPNALMQYISLAGFLLLFIMPIAELHDASRKKVAQAATGGQMRLTLREIFSAVSLYFGLCLGAIAGVTTRGDEHAGAISCSLAATLLLGTAAGCILSYFFVLRPGSRGKATP